MSTRGSETERSNPGALLTQLKDKLKSQSVHIRLLESYKILCEQRVLDLYPNHPLPVLKEHLGQSLYSETLPLKQKISKLEEKLSNYCDPYLIPTPIQNYQSSSQSLYQRFCLLEREKSEVEESLRNEVRLNEEQRSYIEVLRQSLELNIEKLGLEGLKLEDFISLTKVRAALQDKTKEYSKLLNWSKEVEYQNYALKDVIEVKNEENLSLERDLNEKTGKLQDLEDLARALKEELARVEEEKARLVDYIDNSLEFELKATAELKQVSEKLERTSKDLARSQDLQRSLGVDKRLALEQVNSLKTQSAELQAQERLARNGLREALDKLDLKEKESIAAGEELRKVRESEAGLAQRLRKVEQSLNDLKQESEKIHLENISLLETLEQNENLIGRAKESIETAQKLRVEVESSASLAGSLSQSNQVLSQQLESHKCLLGQETCKNKALAESLEQLSRQVLSLKSGHDEEIQNHLQLISTLQESLEASAMQAFQQAQQISALENQAKALKEQIATLDSLIKPLQAQNSSLEGQARLLQESEKAAKAEARSYFSQLDALTQFLDSLNSAAPPSPSLPSLPSPSSLHNSDQFENLHSELQSIHSKLDQSQSSDLMCKFQFQSESLVRLKQENLILNETLTKIFDDLKNVYLSFGEAWRGGSCLMLVSSLAAAVQDALEQRAKLAHEASFHAQSSKQSSALASKLELGLSGSRAETLQLKSKNEKLSLEVERLGESSKSQVASLQAEICVLRASLKALHEENEKLESQVRTQSMALTQNHFKQASLEVNLSSSEEKYSLLQQVKLNLLNLIQKIQSSLNSASLQSTLSEMLRVHSELECCSLEKLRLSMMFRKLDQASSSLQAASLAQQLADCSSLIAKHLSKLAQLESEINI